MRKDRNCSNYYSDWKTYGGLSPVLTSDASISINISIRNFMR